MTGNAEETPVAAETVSLATVEAWLASLADMDAVEREHGVVVAAAAALDRIAAAALEFLEQAGHLAEGLNVLGVPPPAEWRDDLDALLEDLSDLEPYDAAAILRSGSERSTSAYTRRLERLQSTMKGDWKRLVDEDFKKKVQRLEGIYSILEHVPTALAHRVRLHGHLQSLRALNDEIRQSPLDWPKLLDIEKRLARAWGDVDRVAGTDAINFVLAAAGGGAPLRSVTPDVLDWLEKQELLDRLTVRFTAKRSEG